MTGPNWLSHYDDTAMVDFEKATKRDFGEGVNDVINVPRPFASRHGFLTA